MGSKFIGALLIAIFVWVGYLTYEYWQQTKNDKGEKAPAAERPVKIAEISPLPPRLEEELARAQEQGVPGLKAFLAKYQESPALKDPRKAWIELDYVLQLSLKNPGEARRVFLEVKKRVDKSSPAYARVQKMQANYE